MTHPAASTGAQREKLNAQPYDLVPFQEITDAYVRVAEFGARKYEPWNWTKGLSRVQLIGSMLRHTFAYLRGEERDNGPKGSGLLHTDHILWNAVALSHNVHHGLEDGRRVEPPREYKTPSKTTVIYKFCAQDDPGAQRLFVKNYSEGKMFFPGERIEAMENDESGWWEWVKPIKIISPTLPPSIIQPNVDPSTRSES